MKRLFRWVLWLTLAGQVIDPVIGEFMVLSGPVYYYGTWYSQPNRLAKSAFCVTDDLSSSLIWNTYFKWDYLTMAKENDIEKKSEIIKSVSHEYSNDELTCQMSQYTPCSRSWNYGRGWSNTSTTENPMSPVFDNRWEDFPVWSMTEHFQSIDRLNNLGSTSVSIRGSTDAHFALCDRDSIQSFCFFIILGGWNNQISVLRKCEKGIPDPMSEWPKDDCKTVIALYNASVLSPDEWRTFTINWNFRDAILSVYNTQERILHYEMLEPTTPNTQNCYLFARGRDRMKMKFHKYSYSFASTTQSKLWSPKFVAAPPGKTVCVEMSISLCKTCTLTVDFLDAMGKRRPAGNIVRNRVQNNLYDLPVWQNVKFNKTLHSTMQEPIMLEINTLNNDSTSKNSEYWKISNVRRCFDGAIKVVAFDDYQDYKNAYFWHQNITCQKISANGTSAIIHLNDIKKSTIDPEKRQTCPEGKIGSFCSVTCSKLFPKNGDCRQLVTCDENGCSCAQGFIQDLPKCDKYCSMSYGYDCQQKCGNCAYNSCHFATGQCTMGCSNTKSNYYLPPKCNEGIGSPPVPKVEEISSSTVRLSLVMINEYKVIPTIIHFEVWENSTAIFVSKNLTINNTTVIESYAGLRPGTHYKVAGFVHAVNRTFQSEWGSFVTSCTESVDLDFIIKPEENEITVINSIHDDFEDPCPYTWYRVELYSYSQLLFNESTNFPKTFTNLKSYTAYRILIISEKSVIVNRTVHTLEGAPSEVQNLEAISSFSDLILCTWKTPESANGKILNYTAQIEPIRSLGCSDLKKPSYNSTTGYNDSAFEKISVITNTTKTIYNITFSGLKPYTEYRVIVYACTSRHCGRKKEKIIPTLPEVAPSEVFANLHLTKETSATTAAKLRWDPPSDCSSITGAIQAAKLYIKKVGGAFRTVETNDYYYDLEKLDFEGAEHYEVRLHTLRYSGGIENKTAYISLKFQMPDREPPPVLDFEVVEVDTENQVSMLRWKAPNLPHHGKLDYYSISFCERNIKTCDEKHHVIVNNNEYCTFWNLKGMLCKSISLPSEKFYNYKITAFNKEVVKASEPIFLHIQRSEFEPTKPTNLFLNVSNIEKALVNVIWDQPFYTGGRLSKFEIRAYLTSTNLKATPWECKDYAVFINDTYHSQYISVVDLLPSSSFVISVRGMTRRRIAGHLIQKEITLEHAVNFNSTSITPKTNDDQMISLTIPAIINDINDSAMVVQVKGANYCDNKNANDQDNVFLQKSSKFNLTWNAAILTNHSKYANCEFKIGDGEVYGGVKNYRLCPKETYVVRIVLIKKEQYLLNKCFKSSDKNILVEIESNEIFTGELPKHYAAWIIPFVLIAIITALFIFMYYRKHSCFMMKKLKDSPQENMPLSNDFIKNKSNNVISEVEKDSKINDEKELLHNNIFIVEKKTEYVMPVKVQDFGNYFEYAFKSGILNKEYKTIKRGLTRPYTYGSQPETKLKNRYANLFPYDDTRVVLEKLPDDPYSDYINANFITGYGEIPKAYIATQGPKQNTVIDFWRMVWQEKVKIICMMANLIENGKTKCEQYWPSAVGKKILYGTVSVNFESEEVHSDYTYRTFKVRCINQDIFRTVEHLHFTAWPDHGVPSNPRSIVAFLQEIQRHAPAPRKSEDPPIVVHCSAGVGRTGTLIVLDMAVCRIFSEKVIDIYANVLSVREERLNMVDNTEQYLLAHLVLVEFLNLKDTCFTCDKTLPKKIKEAKKHSSAHYQRILDTNWWNEVLGSPPLPEKTVSMKNRAKHRFPETADGLNRIYLKRSNRYDEDSDYIAATCVRGIFNNCQYITTQLPMPSTAVDFWRMLAELNVELVLILQLPDLQDPTYCELIPESQSYGSINYLKVIRQQNSTLGSQFYQEEEVRIIDGLEQPSKEQTVKIITYKNWPEASLPPPSELVSLWKAFNKFPNQSDHPIVVVCRDGITVSGLWLTMSILLKRMDIDKECDVLQAVRSIKRCRKNFLNQIKYFNYLYDVALEWFIQTRNIK